jgi:hypothetical protein
MIFFIFFLFLIDFILGMNQIKQKKQQSELIIMHGCDLIKTKLDYQYRPSIHYFEERFQQIANIAQTHVIYSYPKQKKLINY